MSRLRIRAICLFVSLASTGGVLASAGAAYAQAEPAPPSYVPPGHHGDPERPTAPASDRWHLMAFPRLTFGLGGGPGSLPRIGWGGGVELSYAIVAFGPVRFGVGGSFAFDRFTHDYTAGGTQSLQHNAFAALFIFDAIVGPNGIIRPFVGLGGGLSAADYRDPGPPRVDEVDVVGMIKAELGLGVRIFSSEKVGVEVGLHGDTEVTFSTFKSGTPPRSVFSPGLVAIALDLGFRF